MTKVLLSIGGFDPTSGAGVIADIRTANALGEYAVSVITSVVVQNSLGVIEVEPIRQKVIRDQLKCLKEDFSIGALKISMPYSKEIAKTIVEMIGDQKVPIVFDPIIKSKNGFFLIKKEDIWDVLNILFPVSALVTPNIDEASFFAKMDIEKQDDLKEATKRITKLGAKAVLIKGGHLKGEEKTDVLFDGKDYFFFKEKTLNYQVHGTGCVFSSAIAVYLLKGYNLNFAVENSKKFITKIISGSLKLGKGYRLVNF